MPIALPKYLFIAPLIFLFGACAQVEWGMELARNKEMVWPPAPNPVKAQYVGEITSFLPIGKSFKSFLFGTEEVGRIRKPVAVSVADDGRIAIADAEMHGIHLFVPSKKKYVLLNRASKTSIISPVGVAFDDELLLYVTDSVLRKVFVYDQDGNYIKEISQVGNGALERPTGVAFHRQQGLLFVADTIVNKIFYFDKKHIYAGDFGERGAGEGQFNFPTHIATDYQGRILVNDTMNFRLQLFSVPDKFITQFGNHGDGSGDFAMPKGVAADRWGVIYVAEPLFDRIQLFNNYGEYLMSMGTKGAGQGEFWMPSGIFIDRHDRLYVCDTYNKRIQVFQLHGLSAGGL